MTREEVEIALLKGENVGFQRDLFPTLDDQGWSFTTEPRELPVVITPSGVAMVGRPDDDGILWTAGTAYVAAGGDCRKARENSLSWTPDCTAGIAVISKFRVARGFGQTPVLAADEPIDADAAALRLAEVSVREAEMAEREAKLRFQRAEALADHARMKRAHKISNRIHTSNNWCNAMAAAVIAAGL